jgi:hypothetical protein
MRTFNLQLVLVLLLSIAILALAVLATRDGDDSDDQRELVASAIKRYGGGSIDGVEIVVAPAWELECGGSCIHYARKRIEVARGERWRQDLMHEVTHWLLYVDGHPPGTHHPIMLGRGLCYGGCDDVPQIGHGHKNP